MSRRGARLNPSENALQLMGKVVHPINVVIVDMILHAWVNDRQALRIEVPELLEVVDLRA